jgi:hypothetical protein
VTLASARLWSLDKSRLKLNDDLFVNVQQAMAVYATVSLLSLSCLINVFVFLSRSYHTGDESREFFFKQSVVFFILHQNKYYSPPNKNNRVLADVFTKPTYRALFALLDNYEAETGKREVVTAEEERENWYAITFHVCIKFLMSCFFSMTHTKAIHSRVLQYCCNAIRSSMVRKEWIGSKG